MKKEFNACLAGLVAGFLLLGSAPLRADPVTVQEVGVGNNQIVTIYSSSLGTANVYAGILNLKVDGVGTQGFCIDPFHWSSSAPMAYSTESLDLAPKAPAGGMGATIAMQIEQLWQQYFGLAQNNKSYAAGLQIAIWELVASSDAAKAAGATFKLVSGNDFGAGDMINWVKSNPAAQTASLLGLTGAGQDYVIQNVPDGGTTVGLLGLGLLALSSARRWLRAK